MSLKNTESMDRKFLNWICPLLLTLLFCSCGGNVSQENVEVIDEELVDDDEAARQSLSKVYSHKYYSVRYPGSWSIMEQVDETIDVYIGPPTGDGLGFTIGRFMTELPLSEINKEGKENLELAGFDIVEDKSITLHGVKMFRGVYDVRVQGQKYRQISYTFKKGDMLYNVRFGNALGAEREALVAEIMDSFRFN